jgi:hypothetical protein
MFSGVLGVPANYQRGYWNPDTRILYFTVQFRVHPADQHETIHEPAGVCKQHATVLYDALYNTVCFFFGVRDPTSSRYSKGMTYVKEIGNIWVGVFFFFFGFSNLVGKKRLLRTPKKLIFQ